MADPYAVDPQHIPLLDKAQDILEYRFENLVLLEDALTHPSADNTPEATHNYERLEFLGDSILGAIVADEIFARFPDLDEGGMTRIKVSLVSGSMLSQVAEDLGLADVIIFGDSEIGTQGRGLHSALENTFEAIVAALFLDGGVEAARTWVMRVLIPLISKDMAAEPENPKSHLQELLQAQHKKPIYRIVGTDGPPHDRVFKAEVVVDDKPIGKGQGRSKKEAESEAAQQALELLGFYRDDEEKD